MIYGRVRALLIDYFVAAFLITSVTSLAMIVTERAPSSSFFEVFHYFIPISFFTPFSPFLSPRFRRNNTSIFQKLHGLAWSPKRHAIAVDDDATSRRRGGAGDFLAITSRRADNRCRH